MKLIKENLAVIAAIVGPLAALLAFVIRVDERIVYHVIFLSTTCIVLLAIWARSRFNTNKEQNNLRTLFRDSLLPSESDKVLGLKTEIAIIGDKDSQGIYDDFCEEFRELEELTITHFGCDSSDKELQKSKLRDLLSGAESVIVVRTRELEKHPWVYEVLDSWAFQQSHIPILMIDKIGPKKSPHLKLNLIPEKYSVVPDDKASLPWRLLKRASERSFAWRNQASFNRAVALAFFILLITSVITAYFAGSFLRSDYTKLVENQPRENYRVLQNIYSVVARHTKDDYEESITKKDDKLNVSYWVSFRGTYYPLSTTEEGHTHRRWTSNEPSIIGCAFAQPNRFVLWDQTRAEPLVQSFNGEPTPQDSRCQYGKEAQRKLTSIVCASYNASPDPDHAVGICVSTESEGNSVSNIPAAFLKKRTREFYESVFPLITDKKLIPE